MRYSEARVSPREYVAARDQNGRPLRDADGHVLTITAWVVTIGYLPGSDEMWETLEHPAHFRDKARAERFATRINTARRGRDLSQWCFRGHACSPLGPNPTGPAPYSVL